MTILKNRKFTEKTNRKGTEGVIFILIKLTSYSLINYSKGKLI